MGKGVYSPGNPRNTGNLLEFLIPPGNTGSLLESNRTGNLTDKTKTKASSHKKIGCSPVVWKIMIIGDLKLRFFRNRSSSRDDRLLTDHRVACKMLVRDVQSPVCLDGHASPPGVSAATRTRLDPPHPPRHFSPGGHIKVSRIA